MTDKCVICSAGDKGRLWTRDVVLGRKNLFDMSKHFGCTQEEAMEHVNKHEIIVDDDGNYNSPDFYISKLLKILKTLEDMVSYDMIMNTDMKNQDKETTIKVLKECRETLKALGEFQGRLSKDTNINIEIINNQYKQITNMIVAEVCPECQLKIVDLMDEMNQKEPIKVISTT